MCPAFHGLLRLTSDGLAPKPPKDERLTGWVEDEIDSVDGRG